MKKLIIFAILYFISMSLFAQVNYMGTYKFDEHTLSKGKHNEIVESKSVVISNEDVCILMMDYENGNYKIFEEFYRILTDNPEELVYSSKDKNNYITFTPRKIIVEYPIGSDINFFLNNNDTYTKN